MGLILDARSSPSFLHRVCWVVSVLFGMWKHADARSNGPGSISYVQVMIKSIESSTEFCRSQTWQAH